MRGHGGSGGGQPLPYRRRYVDNLRRTGVVTREEVARAFAAVPREVFVAHGFRGRDGEWISPEHPDFLTTVYRDDVLVTKVVDGKPVSSSSQPSLMAVMIEALDLAPGTRVLEIGAGTGYNAALMAAAGARVTSVDVQPDVVGRAAAAVERCGVDGVEVRLGDGYLGAPGAAPYDRVIVTVGVAGVSPHWLDQLTPDGYVVVPVGHAGNHPVLRVRHGAGGVVEARGIASAGFMSATGPLSARYPGAHPEPLGGRMLPAPTVSHPGRWQPPLRVRRYHDLWFAAGVWDRRITFATMRNAGGAGGCGLVGDTADGGDGYVGPGGGDGAGGGGGALILSDGRILATGIHARRYADTALALRDRWVRRGEPSVADWRATLAPAGEATQPILVPEGWASEPSGEGRGH